MKENNDVKPILTDEQLGLENKEEPEKVEIKEEPEKVEIKDENKRKTITKENSKSVKKADSAFKNAAATAALKAAIDANTEISEKEAERTYIKEKMKFMLDKCKNDEVVKFRGDKVYAQYFGKEYSFLYNGVPVTIKFDGSEQEYPKFIYEKIMEKIHEVSESNTPKIQIEDRTEG